MPLTDLLMYIINWNLFCKELFLVTFQAFLDAATANGSVNSWVASNTMYSIYKVNEAVTSKSCFP